MACQSRGVHGGVRYCGISSLNIAAHVSYTIPDTILFPNRQCYLIAENNAPLARWCSVMANLVSGGIVSCICVSCFSILHAEGTNKWQSYTYIAITAWSKGCCPHWKPCFLIKRTNANRTVPSDFPCHGRWHTVLRTRKVLQHHNQRLYPAQYVHKAWRAAWLKWLEDRVWITINHILSTPF